MRGEKYFMKDPLDSIVCKILYHYRSDKKAQSDGNNEQEE